MQALDRVFFVSSGTQAFASEEARAAFRDRWLGRYLRRYPEWAYVAMAPDVGLVGYLVGSLDDPAATPLFEDLAYFRDFAVQTRDYPAQLHVNLLPEWRSLGIGARMIRTFCTDAAMAGAPGVHVVTGRGLRNVRYYAANGFDEVASTLYNGKELVMLARRLP
jgi:GNAT superfamily N-acetyltransferase